MKNPYQKGTPAWGYWYHGYIQTMPHLWWVAAVALLAGGAGGMLFTLVLVT